MVTVTSVTSQPAFIGKLKGSAVPIPAGEVGQLNPTTPDTPIEEIRARFQRDGYLLMKGLLNADIVHDTRKRFFTSVKDTGILAPNTNPEDGIFVGGEEARNTFINPGSVAHSYGMQSSARAEAYLQACLDAQQSDWFHAFSTNPQLVDFVSRLMGWEDPLLMKRQMLRAAVPDGDGIHVHYDQLFFRHGPPTFITCWTPLDHAGPERGGLMYLSDSTRVGQQMEDDFNARAEKMTNDERKSAFNANMMTGGRVHPDAGTATKDFGGQWLTADFEPGDVAFHNPFIIHASCVNQHPSNKVLLHTDIRFVNPNEPFDERWMKYWLPADGA